MINVNEPRKIKGCVRYFPPGQPLIIPLQSNEHLSNNENKLKLINDQIKQNNSELKSSPWCFYGILTVNENMLLLLYLIPYQMWGCDGF